MKIVVDDLVREFPDGASVMEVLRILGEPAKHVLVEVNGVYVREKEYEERILMPGDRMEVILPAFGG